MRHQDHEVFHNTVESHIEETLVWAIQNWLWINVPMAKHSVKEAATLAFQCVVYTITSYFWVIPDEPNPNLIDPSPSGRGHESTLPVGR
jgi:hypothetical protein